MAIVSLDQMPAGKPIAGALSAQSGSFWTPANIKQIIDGMTTLMNAYNRMRSGQGGNNDVMDNSDAIRQPVQQGAPAAPGVTMPQVLALGKQICTNLETQGYGDSTILQVLEKFPFTIKQLKGMLPS